MAQLASVIHSRWQFYFENMQFSSDEFYSAIEEKVKSKKVKDMSVSRITLSEGGILSAGREYLRVSRKGHVFDICASPFGTDFFVSWWLGETTGIGRALVSRVPVVGSFLAKASTVRTYYQIDTEIMFKESVRSMVNETIDKMTEGKGARKLTDLERKPVEASLN